MQLYEHVYNIFTVLPCNTGLQLLRQTQLPRWFRRLGEKLNQYDGDDEDEKEEEEEE